MTHNAKQNHSEINTGCHLIHLAWLLHFHWHLQPRFPLQTHSEIFATPPLRNRLRALPPSRRLRPLRSWHPPTSLPFPPRRLLWLLWVRLLTQRWSAGPALSTRSWAVGFRLKITALKNRRRRSWYNAPSEVESDELCLWMGEANLGAIGRCFLAGFQ